MIDPLKLFHRAEAFRLASSVLGEKIHVTPNLMAPYAVAGAFALELYLKCILSIERANPKKEHDLVKLFALVSPQTQTRIREHFLNQSPVATLVRLALESKVGKPIDFDATLSRSKDVFFKWRYPDSYGWDVGASGWSDDIVEVTRAVILDLRPDWSHSGI